MLIPNKYIAFYFNQNCSKKLESENKVSLNQTGFQWWHRDHRDTFPSKNMIYHYLLPGKMKVDRNIVFKTYTQFVKWTAILLKEANWIICIWEQVEKPKKKFPFVSFLSSISSIAVFLCNTQRNHHGRYLKWKGKITDRTICSEISFLLSLILREDCNTWKNRI